MHARTLGIAFSFAAITGIGIGIAACLGDPPLDTPNEAGANDSNANPDDSQSGDAGCPVDQTVCAGACVDLKTSATSCGKCGRSCFGGTCTASTCSAYVVAKQPTTGVVAKLATDGKRVVWVDTGIVAILQIAPGGGTPITLGGSSGVDPELSLANGVVAFAYNNGSSSVSVGIAHVDEADSGVALIPGTNAIESVSLSTSAGHVFYVDKTGTTGNLYDSTISPGDAGTRVALVSSARFGVDVAADDAHMFFEEQLSGLYVETIGTGTAQFAPPTSTAAHFAVDGTWAYWSESDDGGLLHSVHRTLESSAGTQMQTPVDTIHGSSFATDGANIYYWDGASVLSRPVAGGPDTTVAPATALTQIAVGGGLLVWTDGAQINGLVLP